MVNSSDKARKSLSEVTLRHDGRRPYPFHELVIDAYKTILNLHSRTEGVTGYPTGFVDLDHVTNGLQPGELIVIASRPSMGKTTLALNIAQYLGTKKNKKIASAIFSLEMSKEQLAMRMLSATACIGGE